MKESNPPLWHPNRQFQTVLYFSGTHQNVKERKYYLRISSHWSATASRHWGILSESLIQGIQTQLFFTFWGKCNARKKSSYMFYLSWLCASVLIYCLPEAQAFCKALAQYEIQQSSLSNSHSPLLCLQLLFFFFFRLSSGVKWKRGFQKSRTIQYLPLQTDGNHDFVSIYFASCSSMSFCWVWLSFQSSQ